MKPPNFETQAEMILKITKEMANAIIIDSFNSLMRVDTRNGVAKLKDMISQLVKLKELEIPVLITCQIYENFNTKEQKIIGGDFILYASSNLIKLENLKTKIRAIMLKPEYKQIIFEVT
jgi:archaellum biogenesis ATPase FlaH